MTETSTTIRRNAIRNLAWYWLPPFAWMGMIFYFSAQPDLPSPPQPWFDALLKKGGHFGVYAMLAFWWWRALSGGERTGKMALFLAFVISVLYGVSDELHQGFVPGRNPSPVDLLIDSAGAAAGLWLVWRRKRISS